MGAETIQQATVRGMIFDMDNTLFDFIYAKLRACEAIVDHIGRGERHELFGYFRRDLYGFENPGNIKDYLIDMDCFSQNVFDECCRIYEDVKLSSIELYPGVMDTLKRLGSEDIVLAILTDAEMRETRLRLERTGINSLFDSVFTYDITGHKKPSHEAFRYALGSMGLEPYETVFVGDSLRRDIAPAKQLGMRAIHASYGCTGLDSDNAPIDERPDHVLLKFSELQDILLNGRE